MYKEKTTRTKTEEGHQEMETTKGRRTTEEWKRRSPEAMTTTWNPTGQTTRCAGTIRGGTQEQMTTQHNTARGQWKKANRRATQGKQTQEYACFQIRNTEHHGRNSAVHTGMKKDRSHGMSSNTAIHLDDLQ